MRTKEGLEKMIDYQAEVRFGVLRPHYPAMIDPWPFRKIIHLHFAFLHENRFSDADVKAVLLHQLTLRKIPLFNAGPIIALLGFVMVPVMVGLRWADSIGRNWVWSGFGLVVLGVLVRVVLHDYLERRADCLMQDVATPMFTQNVVRPKFTRVR